MPLLTDTQQEVYNVVLDFIQQKLDFYVQKILEIQDPNIKQASLNALYVTVEMSLSLDKETKRLLHGPNPNVADQVLIEQGVSRSKARLEQVSQHFFPAEGHQQIRSFFSKLHDLYYGNDPNHKMISAITDPRLGSGNPSPQYVGKLLQRDCHKWLREEHHKKRYKQKDLLQVAKNLKASGVLGLVTEESEEQKISSNNTRTRSSR